MSKKLLMYFMPLIGILAITFSCKEGEKGDPGPNGVGVYKTDNGSLSGTIHYQYPNGDTAIVPFSNKGYSSYTESILYIDSSMYNDGNYYSFDVLRIDPEDDKSYLRIGTCWADMDIDNDTCFSKPYSIIYGVSKISVSNNYFFAFATMSDVYEYDDLGYYYVGEGVSITNFYLNPTTHRLTFDYNINIYPAEYNWESGILPMYVTDYNIYAKVNGSVDVVLKSTPYPLEACYIEE